MRKAVSEDCINSFGLLKNARKDKDLAEPLATPAENAVRVMTVHASKGLSFPLFSYWIQRNSSITKTFKSVIFLKNNLAQVSNISMLRKISNMKRFLFKPSNKFV